MQGRTWLIPGRPCPMEGNLTLHQAVMRPHMEKSRKLTARQKYKLSRRSVDKLKHKLIKEVKVGKCFPISKKEYTSWILSDR